MKNVAAILALPLTLAVGIACGEREMMDGPVYTASSAASADTGDGGSSGGETTDDTAGSSGGSGSSGATDPTGASSGGSGGNTTDDPGGSTGDPTAGTTGDPTGGGALEPPAGGSSGGSGGGSANGEVRNTSMGGIQYRVIAPGGSGPFPAMIIYSGTEGGAAMTSNIQQIAGYVGLSGLVFGILDGTQYYGNGQAGAYVLDQLRADYDVLNDETYLLSESAGTSAGLELGLQLRQSYFAAFWANDVNASLSPALSAGELGFAPWGQAGPGGDWPDANAIVSGMDAAGYRLPNPAPYDGPGADQHGNTDQFMAALSWFSGKTRQ